MPEEIADLIGDMEMELTEADLKRERRYFTSKMYHRAVKHALHNGGTTVVAQHAGRAASALAADLYNRTRP